MVPGLLLLVPLIVAAAGAAPAAALSFAAPAYSSTENAPVALAVADMNGDGVLDVVTADAIASTVSVLLGDGTGGFSAARHVSTGADPSDIAVADLDGDGSPDLLTANPGSATVGVRLYGPLTTPVLRRISPATGSGGTVVTLSGMHFGAKRGRSAVLFGDLPATRYLRWSDTSLKVRVPAGTASGDVPVQVKT